MNIGLKITAAFGGILVLLLGLSGFGIWSAESIDDHVAEISEVRVPSLEGLILMEMGIQGIIAHQRELLISNLPADRVATCYDEITRMRTEYKKGMDLYAPLPQTPEEAKLWQEFLEKLKDGKLLNDEFFALQKEYRQNFSQEVHDRMVALTVEKIVPNNKAIIHFLNKIVDLNIHIADESAAEADEHVHINKLGIFIISGIAVPLALLFGFLLFRSIAVPLRKAKVVAEEFANGKLSSRMKLNRKDEIGALATALDHMANVFSSLINGIQTTSAALGQGHLRKELQVEGVHNDYKDLVDSLNESFRSIVLLVDSLPAPIMIRDKNKNINFINTAATLGITTVSGAEGRKCSDHFKTEHCLNGNCACDKAFQIQDKVVAQTVANPSPDMTLEIEYTAIPFGKDAVVEFIVNLSEIKKAQRQLLQSAVNSLEDIVSYVTSGSEELSVQIEQSTQGASSQGARVSETAAAMNQMTATVFEVAKSTSTTAATADEAKLKAQEGSTSVARVIEDIGEVEKQALVLKDDMATLGTQANGIGEIMNVISDIADQTNLLALNAAIEAARAGEAGRGFAVVADEVRKLAEKTMTATNEVGLVIRGIQDGARTNIEHVDQAVNKIEVATSMANSSGDALKDIVNFVVLVTDQVRSIATATEEQSSVSDEINKNIEDVNRIAVETTTAMQQAEEAVMGLAQQTHALSSLINDLQNECNG